MAPAAVCLFFAAQFILAFFKRSIKNNSANKHKKSKINMHAAPLLSVRLFSRFLICTLSYHPALLKAIHFHGPRLIHFTKQAQKAAFRPLDLFQTHPLPLSQVRTQMAPSKINTSRILQKGIRNAYIPNPFLPPL